MKVSLITASYNSSSNIISAIESVNSQVYPLIEHIFIDGASSDDTVDIIGKHSKRQNIVISEPDDGIYYALNKALDLSTGDIIGFVHSDDYLADPYVIQDVVDSFNSSSSPSIVYGDLKYVSRSGDSVIRNWIAGEFSHSKMRNGWMPPHPSFYMLKTSYLDYGFFDTNYRISADYEAMLRYMFFNRQNILYLNRVLTFMRVGGSSNANFKQLFRKSIEDYTIMTAVTSFPLIMLLKKNLSKIHQFFI